MRTLLLLVLVLCGCGGITEAQAQTLLGQTLCCNPDSARCGLDTQTVCQGATPPIGSGGVEIEIPIVPTANLALGARLVVHAQGSAPPYEGVCVVLNDPSGAVTAPDVCYAVIPDTGLSEQGPAAVLWDGASLGATSVIESCYVPHAMNGCGQDAQFGSGNAVYCCGQLQKVQTQKQTNVFSINPVAEMAMLPVQTPSLPIAGQVVLGLALAAFGLLRMRPS